MFVKKKKDIVWNKEKYSKKSLVWIFKIFHVHRKKSFYFYFLQYNIVLNISIIKNTTHILYEKTGKNNYKETKMLKRIKSEKTLGKYKKN